MAVDRIGGAGSPVVLPARVGNGGHRVEETGEPSGAVSYRKTSIAMKTQEGDMVACAGVRLKGTINSCNVLTVEGEIEATLQARQLVITNGGAFLGKADVDDADIGGRFEGTLHAAGKLTVRRSGRINGQVSYGQIEVEPGGELRGNITVKVGNRRSGIFSITGSGRF